LTIERPSDALPGAAPAPSSAQAVAWHAYLLALVACGVTALIASPLRHWLDQANTAMLFVLTVVLVAIRLGRRPAILAALVSVGLFDFFFVPPHLSFAVADVQYLVTFAVMLVVALTISHLATGLSRQVEAARRREAEVRALYAVAQRTAGAATVEQLVEVLADCVREGPEPANMVLMVPEEDEHGAEALKPVATEGAAVDVVDMLVAQSVHRSGHTVLTDAETDQSLGHAYVPAVGATGPGGVLVYALAGGRGDALRGRQARLEALASLAATALERLHFVEIAQKSHLAVASERLRNSILAALSHDVRTPLTALYGTAEALLLGRPELPAAARELAQDLRDQALRLSRMVDNLLDMARLQSGKLQLRREWQPLEEVVGASIQLLGRAAAEHPVEVRLPADLPLLEFDGVLLERVFCNLLENAFKYAPPDSAVRIAAEVGPREVTVRVEDCGPGFSAEQVERVFELFERGAAESSLPGMGVGLAICRAIVEAHGGHIRAGNRPGGGGCVSFALPRGTPPAIEAEEGEGQA
jgi:two-component system, OmpR family, sensor histidine kinase KdpD